MIEIAAVGVPEFMRLLLPTEPILAGQRWFYRGQGDANWGLVPSIRRKKGWTRFGSLSQFGLHAEGELISSGAETVALAEREVLATLGHVAKRFGLLPHLCDDGPSRAAYARHIGLPTRILDWTLSPLTAAYFAASEAARNTPADGKLAVFAISRNRVARMCDDEELTLVEPVAIGNPNLMAQHGILLRVNEKADLLDGIVPEVRTPDYRVSPHQRGDFRHQLIKFTLPWSSSLPLLRELREQQVHAATVYPGQHGIAELVGEVYLSDPEARSESADVATAASEDPPPPDGG